MAERKPLSPKTRFEVFMRDRFRCQYCGRPAPEVALEVDHIKPVSAGGTDAMSNLITACRDCNRGKGTIEIEHSVSNKEIDAIAELYVAGSGLAVTQSGRDHIRSLIIRYGFYAVYRASEAAVGRYCKGRSPHRETVRAFKEMIKIVQKKKRRWFGGRS